MCWGGQLFWWSTSYCCLRSSILDLSISILVTSFRAVKHHPQSEAYTRLYSFKPCPIFNVDDIEKQLTAMASVKSVHHTHVWSLDGEHHVLTTHVVVDPCTTREEVLQLKREINNLTEHMDIAHTTLEIEYEDEDCRMVKKNGNGHPVNG
jgi:cobalt-zinc-cadmium efflux system protein